MIKEIGGEFYKKPKLNVHKKGIFNLLVDYNYQFFESGREGFSILKKSIRKKILFPVYACESMLQYINRENIIFYNIDYEFNLDIKDIEEKINKNNDIEGIIFINYFGRKQPQEILKYLLNLKKRGILIVEDTTHSFFSEVCTIGDICICSFRKWFCIPNGGIIYSKKK